ncbi:MAG: 30S ribosomal protein S6, partial [Anaerotignum sp.]|nr:30S ribosomal protein S6 [Anaerotignum sp.]
DWGKRKLAYEIAKVNEGFYSFTTFEAPAAAPAEIEARMRIMENVLRYLIIRKEA